jgi:1-deoxy-D-xylulose-5-phosphate reductoisomerase
MLSKRISVLGSTGSIGTQTLEVAANFPHKFKVIGLAAGQNIELLKKQISQFKPEIVNVAAEKDTKTIEQFVHKIGSKTKVTFGHQGLIDVAINKKNDFLIVAITGTASLEPTYLAIKKKIPIGLASKEILVIAGNYIIDEARLQNVPIIPVDSEHAAIKQCLSSNQENISEVEKLIITASGGPFWQKDASDFKSITKKEALKHPNWSMGQKITIDSATLMNKGLEVIEAHHLFKIPFSQIEVVIHPESIIHSMVEFVDGTLIAQMSQPDMRFPIQYALSYPQKLTSTWPKLDLTKLTKLSFHKPDFAKFPLLKLAYEAGEKGGVFPIILNAADDLAVKLFLEDKLSFFEIPEFVLKAFTYFKEEKLNSLTDIINYEKTIKEYLIKKYA